MNVVAVPQRRAVATLRDPPFLYLDVAEAEPSNDFADGPRRALLSVQRQRSLDQRTPRIVRLGQLPPVDGDGPREPRQERGRASIDVHQRAKDLRIDARPQHARERGFERRLIQRQ
ncbi:hypothetical protein WS78_07420 [Burkholderia savannae]|nr:hypothetical protein WS78_07420 [Burkholderia savannae]